MAKDRIHVTPVGYIDIVRNNHAYVLKPGDDVTAQPQDIQELAQQAWTPEVLEGYVNRRRAQDAQDEAVRQEAEASTQVYLAAERARIRAIVLEVLDERDIRGDRV